MPAGRPSSFKEEYCERIEELASEGKIPVQWAADIGVSHQTLHNWCTSYPQFLEAYRTSKSICQAALIEQLGKEPTRDQLSRVKWLMGGAFQFSENAGKGVKVTTETTEDDNGNKGTKTTLEVDYVDRDDSIDLSDESEED
jgi:hypothetical protein